MSDGFRVHRDREAGLDNWQCIGRSEEPLRHEKRPETILPHLKIDPRLDRNTKALKLPRVWIASGLDVRD